MFYRRFNRKFPRMAFAVCALSRVPPRLWASRVQLPEDDPIRS